LGTARSARSQSATVVRLPQTTRDSLVKKIRVIFQRINSDTTLRVVDLDVDELEEAIGGSPDNGGEVKGYFKKDTLYKLYLSVGPSYGLKDYEYYYDRGEIVFIYEKDQHYPVKKEGGLDNDKIVVGFEGRFYFNKGKLISKVIKRYDHFMAEEIDEAYIKELLDVGSYVKQLRKHLVKKK
jgi:hypothetical protein